MRLGYHRLIWLQGLTTIAGAVITYFVVNPPAAKSLAYGGCVALMSTLFLAWRLKQSERKASENAEWHLRQGYRSAMERFVWVAAMMAAGFKLLELAPLWILAGFIVGQAAWLLVPVWMRFENTK